MIPTLEDVWKVTEHISDQAMHPVEVEALYRLCTAVPEGGLVVEVGCQLGRSSSIIEQVGKGVGYTTIHIDPYTEQKQFLEGWVRMMHGIDAQFTLLRMRTEQAADRLSALCLDKAGNGIIDLAFIDGDHERPSVEIDMQLVASKIKSGGMLAAHDYTCNAHHGVAEAIDPYVASGLWERLEPIWTMGIWRRK